MSALPDGLIINFARRSGYNGNNVDEAKEFIFKHGLPSTALNLAVDHWKQTESWKGIDAAQKLRDCDIQKWFQENQEEIRKKNEDKRKKEDEARRLAEEQAKEKSLKEDREKSHAHFKDLYEKHGYSSKDIKLPPDMPKDFLKFDPTIKEGYGNRSAAELQFRHALITAAAELANKRESDLPPGQTVVVDTDKRKKWADLAREKLSPDNSRNKENSDQINTKLKDLLNAETIEKTSSPENIRSNLDEDAVNKARKMYMAPYDKELERLEEKHRKYIKKISPILNATRFNSLGTRFHSGIQNEADYYINKANKSLLNKRVELMEKAYDKANAFAGQHLGQKMQAERDIANNISTSRDLQGKGIDLAAAQNDRKNKELSDYIDTTKRHEHDELAAKNVGLQEINKHIYAIKNQEWDRLQKARDLTEGNPVYNTPAFQHSPALMPPEKKETSHASPYSTLGTGLASIGATLMKKTGGRVEKLNGGILNQAIEEARTHRIPTIRSLENLERKLAIEQLDNMGRERQPYKEGGSPIQEGAHLASMYSKLEKRAAELKEEKAEPLLHTVLRNLMYAWKDDPYMGSSSKGAISAYEREKDRIKSREEKKNKAAVIEHEIAKLMREEAKDKQQHEYQKRHMDITEKHYGDIENHNKAIESLKLQEALNGPRDLLKPRVVNGPDGTYLVKTDPSTGELLSTKVPGIAPKSSEVDKAYIKNAIKQGSGEKTWTGAITGHNGDVDLGQKKIELLRKGHSPAEVDAIIMDKMPSHIGTIEHYESHEGH